MDGKSIRNEKVVDSKISQYVWTDLSTMYFGVGVGDVPVSVCQGYPDTEKRMKVG